MENYTRDETIQLLVYLQCSSWLWILYLSVCWRKTERDKPTHQAKWDIIWYIAFSATGKLCQKSSYARFVGFENKKFWRIYRRGIISPPSPFPKDATGQFCQKSYYARFVGFENKKFWRIYRRRRISPPSPFPKDVDVSLKKTLEKKTLKKNFSSSWFPVTCYGQFALPVCEELNVCKHITCILFRRRMSGIWQIG